MNSLEINIKMKRHLVYLVILLFPFSASFCQTKQEEEFVQFVVQPEMEIGKSVDFYIHFKEKPDSIWSSTAGINGLELTDKLDDIADKIKESETTDDNDKVSRTFYSFYTYAKPTKTGSIDFPVLSVRYKGKVYKTPPLSINVVNKNDIAPDAVKVVWSANRTTCSQKDTLSISLYEYTRFAQTKRRHTQANQFGLEGKENQINLSVEETIDNLAGINNFEQSINGKFEITDVDWNMFNTRQSMKKWTGSCT